MKKTNLFFLVITSITLIFFSGCTPVSKITYMNSINKEGWGISPIPPKHKIEIGDILMIKVISKNEESNKLFNVETNTNNANTTTTAANLYLNGFTVSQEGNIELPNVGTVNLLNKTLEEAREIITTSGI